MYSRLWYSLVHRCSQVIKKKIQRKQLSSVSIWTLSCLTCGVWIVVFCSLTGGGYRTLDVLFYYVTRIERDIFIVEQASLQPLHGCSGGGYRTLNPGAQYPRCCASSWYHRGQQEQARQVWDWSWAATTAAAPTFCSPKKIEIFFSCIVL